ncbi:MAG: redoxin family protein, partial [Ignavibacteriae bacterium]|nr:redoxin family protein [Ignavibacteriota bacterium]
GREKVKLDYSMDFITSFPEMFSGIALDKTLSNYLYNTLIKQPNLDIFEKQMEYYNSIVSNQSIKNTINSYYYKTKRIIEESVLTPQMVIKKNNENSGTIFIQNLIKENKGKVIYIDFWAPWCQPCRKQMMFSHDLKKKFENNDVVFIYLCVNSPEKKWKEGVATLKLEGQNYLLNNSQHNYLAQEFNISGIPHYVLVNKYGTIIDKDAERPELGGKLNSKLVSQIKNLLSEEK